MNFMSIFKPNKQLKGEKEELKGVSQSTMAEGRTSNPVIRLLSNNPLTFWAFDRPFKILEKYESTSHDQRKYDLRKGVEKSEPKIKLSDLKPVTSSHEVSSDCLLVRLYTGKTSYTSQTNYPIGTMEQVDGLAVSKSLKVGNLDLDNYDLMLDENKELVLIESSSFRRAFPQLSPDEEKLVSYLSKMTAIKLNSNKTSLRDFRFLVPSMYLDTFRYENRLYYGLPSVLRSKYQEEVLDLTYKSGLIVNNMIGISHKLGMFKDSYKYHLLLLFYCVIKAIPESKQDNYRELIQMFSLVNDQFEVIMRIFEMTENKEEIKQELLNQASEKLLNYQKDLDELYENLVIYIKNTPDSIHMKMNEQEKELFKFLNTVES